MAARTTIETMRSQYTDLLYQLEQTHADLVAERNNRAKLFAGLEKAEAELRKQVERRAEAKLRAVQAEDQSEEWSRQVGQYAEWNATLKAELAAMKAQHRYPHMCRDGHPEIGHSTDNERCPVCPLRDRVPLVCGG